MPDDPVVRVYLPLTFAGLPALRADGLGPAPLTAYAVTPGIVAALPDGDPEELEFVALSAAADASLELLAAAPDAPRRRAVVAVDVPDMAVAPASAPDAHPAEVSVSAPVPRARVAALLVDEAAAAAAVRRALAGDVAALDDVELLWFGLQELEDVLAS